MKKALPYLALLLVGLVALHFAQASRTETVSYLVPAPVASASPYPVPAEVQPIITRLGIPASELGHLHVVISADLSACDGGDNAAPDSCFAAPNTIYMTASNLAAHNQWQNNALFCHEYLHYVWSSLSVQQRVELAPALNTVYHQHAAYLNQRLAGYKLSDQQRLNELHSFIGTEIDDWELPTPLLQHYQHYIPNRSALPSFE